ncbi:hypothetical protein [Pseudophaeobacter leonis]|uniref:hypothetical protein n=1 Tax=Pseudophaeobacter leonis TaxID=1144477 RepID=UPI001F4DE326|nr:hypothetical protein [Pseudophaeobacter leonis]
MGDVFVSLNDQLLRMQWLSDLVALLVRDGFGLDPTSQIGGSVHFFIYDVIKIFILLSVLIFSISYVQSYFPPERTRRILGQRQGWGRIFLQPCWAPLRRFVPAHPFRCSLALPVRACRWR